MIIKCILDQSIEAGPDTTETHVEQALSEQWNNGGGKDQLNSHTSTALVQTVPLSPGPLPWTARFPQCCAMDMSWSRLIVPSPCSTDCNTVFSAVLRA